MAEGAHIRSSFWRNIIYGSILLAVFLVGFVPMWLKARDCSGKLSEAQLQLNLSRIENSIGSAVIDARRGEYEPARQAASTFFTTVNSEIERGDDSLFSTAQREGVQPLLANRDQIITLLARSDPASADRLSDLYVRYRKVMMNQVNP